MACRTDLRLALRRSWSRTLRSSAGVRSLRRAVICAAVSDVVAEDRERPGCRRRGARGRPRARRGRPRPPGAGACRRWPTRPRRARGRAAARPRPGSPRPAGGRGSTRSVAVSSASGARHAAALDGVVEGLLDRLGGDDDAAGQALAHRRQRVLHLVLRALAWPARCAAAARAAGCRRARGACATARGRALGRRPRGRAAWPGDREDARLADDARLRAPLARARCASAALCRAARDERGSCARRALEAARPDAAPRTRRALPRDAPARRSRRPSACPASRRSRSARTTMTTTSAAA